MIAFLRGKLAGCTPTGAVIDVGGVGYGVSMSGRSLSRLPQTGEAVEVLTYMSVSEAGIGLYGFLSESERELFLKLLGVGGVGPKVALAALGAFEPTELVKAIAAEDDKTIARIPGVGKKTAQRIILELKGTLSDFGGSGGQLSFEGGNQAPVVPQGGLEGAIEALLSMGFTSREAELALTGAPEGATEGALLQYALKKLGS